jgi:hypothetical protein
MRRGAVVLVLLVQGCSFLATTFPKSATQPDGCSSHAGTYVAPAIDTAIAGGIAIRLSYVDGSGGEGALSGLRAIGVAIGTAGVLLFGLSALKGYFAVSQCRCVTRRAELAKAK